jgi:hypothetical protein
MECDWDENEKAEYFNIRNRAMDHCYAFTDLLRPDNPSQRFEYLTGRLLNPKDCKDISKLIQQHGRPKTLNILEEIYINNYS